MSSADSLTGARKAAVLLLQLGKDRAAEVLRAMDDAEIQAVTAEMAQLVEIADADVMSVLTEFVDSASVGRRPRGGPKFTREVLAAGLGAERASAMIERMGGPASGPFFTFLTGLEAQAVAELLAGEHPQVAAVVLSTVGPERALKVLREMPAELQGTIAYRVATMTPPSPEVIHQVEAGLARRLAGAAKTSKPVDTSSPLDRLVSLLGNADAETEAAILEQLEELDPALAAEVRDHLLTFEDLARLDDKTMQLVLREVEARDLALALKGAGDAIRAKVTGNLSERAGANLLEEIELLGPQRKADIEAARAAVIAAVRELESAGTIVLSRGNDDLVE